MTGRAVINLTSFGPGSMSRQVNLLIGGTLLFLQLMLPAFAPQLHQLTGCAEHSCGSGHSHLAGSGTAGDVGVAVSRKHCGSVPADHSAAHVGSRCPWHKQEADTGESRAPEPHECVSCAICQVLLAPRCAAAIVSLGEFVAQVRFAVCRTIAAAPAEPEYTLPARAPPVA